MNTKTHYNLDDPALLENMMLADHVKHPETGVVLRTRGALLTPALIRKLRSRGIDSVCATPLAVEKVEQTVTQVRKIFATLEEIIVTKSQSVEDLAMHFQEMASVQQLNELIKKHVREIFHLFNHRAIDALIQLNNHHPDSAHHSVITGFNVASIARPLGWSEEKTLEAVLSAMQHDIGKIKVKLDTLVWPKALDKTQWQEIQLHSLFGGRLLYDGELKIAVMVALVHHEWFASVPGKGYGALTCFRDPLKTTMGIDVDAYLAQANSDQLDTLQVCALADMVAALEEIRSYKGPLVPFKVLVIMNSDAKMGHFNPALYQAWHKFYTKKNTHLLPVGLCVALPREKEKIIFRPGRGKILPHPVEILTFSEMERLGLVAPLQDQKIDLDRVRRRGGLRLEAIQKHLEPGGHLALVSPEALRRHRIIAKKTTLPIENQMIGLDAIVGKLTFDELQRLNLLHKMEQRNFDLDLVRKAGGILLSRLEHRGIEISANKLTKLGIVVRKEELIQLPAFEGRLSFDDLIRLGFSKREFEEKGLLDLLVNSRNGASIPHLRKKGILVSEKAIEDAGIDPERKIFYDIIVEREIDHARGEFAIVREGNHLGDIKRAEGTQDLDPIQDYLVNKVGVVELNFEDLVALPDLSGITMGDHWKPH